MLFRSISVKSRQNEGTTVTICLPLKLAETEPPQGKILPESTKGLAGLHCLLVEDNDLNAEIAQILLEEQGMTVTRAENGRQAVEIFSKEPADTFHLILMDIMMPVMNGLDAARAVRALDRPDAKTIPIIAMTANAFKEDAQKCMEAGMNAHLAKPINIPELISTITRFTGDDAMVDLEVIKNKTDINTGHT